MTSAKVPARQSTYLGSTVRTSWAIWRYYLYRPIAIADKAQIAALYKQGKTNPVTIQIVGSFAPLYEHETIFTTPVGRLLVANQATIQTPKGSKNNSPP
ncbi:MAG: hypothetical protein WAK33_10030 [Silvibacterium sp.]